MVNGNSVLLSVILPIYNVENYLRQAVDSILGADCLDGVEIILVDDGSTDSSGRIADTYLRKGIKVLHKTNGGLSDARNYGLYHATGQYVFFMDSDDKVDSRQFAEFVNFARSSNSEVILWDAKIIDEQGTIINSSMQEYFSHKGLVNRKQYTGKEAIHDQLRDHKDFVTTVWLGAYKREFIIKNSFWFEYGLLHEDELWTPRVLCKAESIEYLNFNLYEYRIRTNSIMTGNGKDRSRNINDLIYIFSNMYNYYDWSISDEVLRRELKANVSKRYLHRISHYNAYGYPAISKKINKVQVFKNSKGIKDRIRSFILLLSGRMYCGLTKSFREGSEIK